MYFQSTLESSSGLSRSSILSRYYYGKEYLFLGHLEIGLEFGQMEDGKFESDRWNNSPKNKMFTGIVETLGEIKRIEQIDNSES